MIRTFYTQALGLFSFLFVLFSQTLLAQIDTVPPYLTCKTNIPFIQLSFPGYHTFAVEYIDSLSDNATLPTNIEVAICEICDTFPLKNGTRQDALILGCPQMGFLPIKIWAKDQAGNIARCSTTVYVTGDASFECFPIPIIGFMKQAFSLNSNLPSSMTCVDSIEFESSQSFISGQTITDYHKVRIEPDGWYLGYGLSSHLFYGFIRPKTAIPGNTLGVDLIDALKIQRHILGLETLSSPYRILAADVNGSGSITSSDVVEIKKLVLGLTNQFIAPQYQFVQENYVFPNLSNPFIPEPPDSVNINSSNRNFLMFKTGDVTGNGCTMLAGGAEDRNGSVHFSFDDQFAQAGSAVKCKMTLDGQFDALQLKLKHPGLQLKNSSLASYSINHQTTEAIALLDELDQLEFEFLAEQDGWLSDLLSLAGESSVAIDKQDQAYSLLLSPKRQPQSVLSISPNPFSHTAMVQFHLPEAQKITWTISDMIGRTIHAQVFNLPAGHQSLPITPLLLPVPGIYVLHLRMEHGSESMIKFIYQSY